jgi:hypothetical protein
LATGYTGRIADGFPLSFPIVLWDGSNWVNTACGCASTCRKSGPGMVHLPGPVGEVTEVRIDDDAALDPSQYAVEGDVLYRRGDSVRWPGQNLSRPLGEPGTWSVTYTRGIPVPAGVDRLTGLLAKEFINACDSTAKCRLPRTVVSTTQRGVTHVFDPTKLLAAGKTGLAEVDMWLAAVNPHHLMATASVL